MIVNGPGALISDATAAYLEQHGLSALRVKARGSAAPQISRDLEDVRAAAMRHVSTHPVREQVAQPREQVRRSEWLTTTAAADLLGVSPRGIQQAISRGRLPAKQDGRRKLVHRSDVEKYKSARRSRA